MKKILGLDLGTNSIGWAVVNEEINENGEPQLTGIEAAGSRIIPMDAQIMGDFERGNSISQTAKRTSARSTRRRYERSSLRRERLNRVLDILGFLPDHYSEKLNRYGQILKGEEPKIAWKHNENGKYEFLFKESFQEMLSIIKCSNPEATKIPYDWTLYYLRKKALTQVIRKEELAWVLHSFNQKRGYYQLREEDVENENKLIEYIESKVISVEAAGPGKKDEIWYNVSLENGMIYSRSSKTPLDWVGKIKEFIVTTDLNDDGTPQKDKEGNIKRHFRQPSPDDWTLKKVKTEADINSANKTVGEYIFDSLVSNPELKIRGKYIGTIERRYYKEELTKILKAQINLQPDLFDNSLYNLCLESLYPNNESHRNQLAKPNFVRLLVEDIIFYQRPLKSKKSLIDNCPFEVRKDKNGNEHPVKCIAKSNPLFQEFRLWKFVSNLKLLERGTDKDVTCEYITSEDDVVALFEWLNNRPSIDQDKLLKTYFKVKAPAKNEPLPVRWNYVEDKDYPCNETRGLILSGLKTAGIPSNVADSDFCMALWHILYSISDKVELEKALTTFANKHNLPQSFVDSLKKAKPFKKDYGAYSEKAIKKFLSLMRCGSLWAADQIDKETTDRIDKILTGEYDENIQDNVRNKAAQLTSLNDFRGLPEWFASYVIYDRFNETKDVCKWETPDDIDKYLASFKQYSLHNPIVEQIVTESLRTVRDIWKKVGSIDEIHIELGRDLKNPAEARRKSTIQNTENENTNERIRQLLAELSDPSYGVEEVRPYSPSQQEILKIYEEGALAQLESEKNIDKEEYEFISKLSKAPSISKNDVIRYKCWLEQHYRSPYTGETIPLSRLFTPAYEIEHIIPQARYYNDSFANKVICESAVNKLKSDLLAHEFIAKHHGEKVEVGHGKFVTILELDAYEENVKKVYGKLPSKKLKFLLLDDIPDDFSSRQLNDSRYISRYVMSLLSNIVRKENEVTTNSVNVIPCNGAVTTRLKMDWGLNDVWNSIILPRFERMNQLTQTDLFTTTANGHVIPDMPEAYRKGFSKKRIDHRHHAMDAIVIACCSRNIVQYLSSVNAQSENASQRIALAQNICTTETVSYKTKERNIDGVWIDGRTVTRQVFKGIKLPWDNFQEDVKSALNDIAISFKNNTRVINRTSNYTERFIDGKKAKVLQTKGDNWAIRKPLHKEFTFGLVNLQKEKTVGLSYLLSDDDPHKAASEGYKALTSAEKISAIKNKELRRKIKELLEKGYSDKQIKAYFKNDADTWADINLNKITIYYYSETAKSEHYYAIRKTVNEDFDRATIENNVVDEGTRKILLRHLDQPRYDGKPELAFSADGIDQMNKNIVALNGGKPHAPIYKVRWCEKANKFNVGSIGNKATKYVESAKGTNLFFAVYDCVTKDKDGNEIHERDFESLPLNTVIDRQKNGLSIAPDINENGGKLLFVLSPNDLVYVPTAEQLENGFTVDTLVKDRIYRMISANKNQCFFIKATVASSIVDKCEFTTSNKMEKSLDEITIKQVCVPLKVDRTGHISLK